MNKFGSFYIKLALIIGGVLIAIFILYYPQTMVSRIRQREKDIANIYASNSADRFSDDCN